MRFFQINFLIFFILLTSCSLKTTKGLIKQKSTITSFKNTYFANSKKDYIYKSKIDIYGNYFGGIIIIKKIAYDHHRIVFTTEFGSKIFDFEFKKHTFKKNFIIPDLDKKLIINTLKNDFEILVKEDAKITNSYLKKECVLYESEFNNKYNFYFVNKKDNQLKKIIHASKSKEKIEFLFTKIVKNTATKINIYHKNIKLKVQLNLISK